MKGWKNGESFVYLQVAKEGKSLESSCLIVFLSFFFFKEGRSFAVRRKGMRHIGVQEISQYLEEFLKEFIDNLPGTHWGGSLRVYWMKLDILWSWNKIVRFSHSFSQLPKIRTENLNDWIYPSLGQKVNN